MAFIHQVTADGEPGTDSGISLVRVPSFSWTGAYELCTRNENSVRDQKWMRLAINHLAVPSGKRTCLSENFTKSSVKSLFSDVETLGKLSLANSRHKILNFGPEKCFTHLLSKATIFRKCWKNGNRRHVQYVLHATICLFSAIQHVCPQSAHRFSLLIFIDDNKVASQKWRTRDRSVG